MLDGGSCTVSEAVVTVLCTPDNGCGWHPKHVEWTCRIINSLLCVASRWTIINILLHCVYFLTFLYKLVLLYMTPFNLQSSFLSTQLHGVMHSNAHLTLITIKISYFSFTFPLNLNFLSSHFHLLLIPPPLLLPSVLFRNSFRFFFLFLSFTFISLISYANLFFFLSCLFFTFYFLSSFFHSTLHSLLLCSYFLSLLLQYS